jgi:hypothetical protein
MTKKTNDPDEWWIEYNYGGPPYTILFSEGFETTHPFRAIAFTKMIAKMSGIQILREKKDPGLRYSGMIEISPICYGAEYENGEKVHHMNGSEHKITEVVRNNSIMVDSNPSFLRKFARALMKEAKRIESSKE